MTIDTIARATSLGGGIVKAVHIAGERTIQVRCTRCGTLLTDTYRASTPHVEVRACCTVAVIRTQAHASACTTKSLRKRATATTGSAVR